MNFWQPDKKKHFFLALLCMSIINVIAFQIFKCGVVYPISLFFMLLAIVLWEYVPEWLPNIFPNRTCSVDDMYAGILGVIVGTVLSVAVNVLIMFFF